MAKKQLKIYKTIGAPTRLLPIGAKVNCANTSAKQAKIFSVKKLRGTKRRLRAAGVGSIVGVTVTKGPEQMKHKMYQGVVIRQKAPYRRKALGFIRFDDNSIILLDKKRDVVKGTIRGVIAKEVLSNPRYAELSGRVV